MPNTEIAQLAYYTDRCKVDLEVYTACLTFGDDQRWVGSFG